MTLTIRTVGRIVHVEVDGVHKWQHKIPRRSRYFKEELRQVRESVHACLLGQDPDIIDLYAQSEMTWYHEAIYHAILRACRRSDKQLSMINVYREEVPPLASANQSLPTL